MSMLKWILTSLFVYFISICQFNEQSIAAIPKFSQKSHKSSLALTPSFDSAMAIPFYRTPTSSFASGQASRNILVSKLKRVELDIHYDTTWDKRTFSLTTDDFYRAIDFSKKVSNKQTIELYEKNENKSKIIMTLPKHTLLNLLKTESYWAKVQITNNNIPKNKSIGWVPLHLLEMESQDTGLIASSIDTYLRKKPESGTVIVTTIPQGTLFSDFKIVGEWVELTYKNQKGFADFNHFISRYDFAKWAKHDKWGWMQIFYRSKNLLYTSEGPLKISEFDAWITNPRLGIMKTNIEGGPMLRSHITINKVNANLWAISQLPEHGEVWWKKEALDFNTPIKKEILSSQEILEREIFSYDFNPKTKPMGVASADGIFITNDGRNWQKLNQFENQNFPVSIHPENVLYVGPYRSSNHGVTFEPYIKWEEIAKIVQSSTLRTSRVLKLVKILPLPHSQVQIQIDTGGTKLKLKSHILSQSWTPVRSEW